ncbi:MAG TPA: PLP-dependent aspartate aminotransferase family protein [Chloroflexota bacterium]|nr:PLP-dependent aspartate aminotransferase family protein [Chloroflexota bacterium]
MTEQDDDWQFATRAVHAGQAPDPVTGSVVPPIYQTATFARMDIGPDDRYFYSREDNPTRAALEQCLASLEGGARALTFASGMAAVTAASYLLRAGDHALLTEDVYGGTRDLYTHLLIDRGITAEFADFTDLDALTRALDRKPRLVWMESPSNPLLKVVDISQVARLARQAGAWLGMDNTFASPYLQRPLALGADLVHYSTTKYLGGHSDVLGGALVVRDPDLGDRLARIRTISGGVPGPMDAWLVLRGTKTLSLRMEAHCANALHLARILARHPAVTEVRYPGLESHPQHALAARQMRRFGGMLAFEVRGGIEAARRVFKRTRLFTFAPSLGGVESLLAHPATMSHAGCTAEERAKIGIGDGLIRISAGIEDAGDLERDLLRALEGL